MDRKFETGGKYWKIGTDGFITLKVDGAPAYQVDIERASCAVGTCNYIAQIRMKTWANDAILADFIRTLHDVVNLYAIN